MVAETIWNEVDDYFDSKLNTSDTILDDVLKNNLANELPVIDVSPSQGKFLSLLVKMHGAKRILEIGTLGGYSTIFFARAIPDHGKVVTLEIDPHHAKVAAENFVNANLSEKIDLRIGDASECLKLLYGEKLEPFDFVFIDADKQNNATYFEWALKLIRAGGVIVVDNVVREGNVINAESDDPGVQGIRKMIELIQQLPSLTCSFIQTVGKKGYDGLLIAFVE